MVGDTYIIRATNEGDTPKRPSWTVGEDKTSTTHGDTGLGDSMEERTPENEGQCGTVVSVRGGRHSQFHSCSVTVSKFPASLVLVSSPVWQG